MARTRRHLVAVPAPHAGQFTAGNAGARAIVVLPGFEVETAAEWMRPHLVDAQRRYRGALTSGLFKRCGTRLHGLLRAACIADATHDALTAYAASVANVDAARGILADARVSAREARTAWSKIFSLVGHVYQRTDADPLASLATSMSDDDTTEADHHE